MSHCRGGRRSAGGRRSSHGFGRAHERPASSTGQRCQNGADAHHLETWRCWECRLRVLGGRIPDAGSTDLVLTPDWREEHVVPRGDGSSGSRRSATPAANMPRSPDDTAFRRSSIRAESSCHASIPALGAGIPACSRRPGRSLHPPVTTPQVYPRWTPWERSVTLPTGTPTNIALTSFFNRFNRTILRAGRHGLVSWAGRYLPEGRATRGSCQGPAQPAPGPHAPGISRRVFRRNISCPTRRTAELKTQGVTSHSGESISHRTESFVFRSHGHTADKRLRTLINRASVA